MPYVTTSVARLTRSARGELFNPLIYPFLLMTLAYGIGFTFFRGTDAVQSSSLFTAMGGVDPNLTALWGALAIITIIVGVYVLIFDKPPIGKINCFVSWLIWVFAAMCYVLTGGWLALFSVAIPCLIFWTWQYFSLAKFRQQDTLDRATMARYNDGQYDDELNPKDSKIDRDNNRGVNTDDRSPD